MPFVLLKTFFQLCRRGPFGPVRHHPGGRGRVGPDPEGTCGQRGQRQIHAQSHGHRRKVWGSGCGGSPRVGHQWQQSAVRAGEDGICRRLIRRKVKEGLSHMEDELLGEKTEYVSVFALKLLDLQISTFIIFMKSFLTGYSQTECCSCTTRMTACKSCAGPAPSTPQKQFAEHDFWKNSCFYFLKFSLKH